MPPMRLAVVVAAVVPALTAPAFAWSPPPAAAAEAAPTPTTETVAASTATEAPQGPIAQAFSPAAAPRLVAVLDLKPGVGADAAAVAMTTMLTAEVSAIDGYKGISRNEIKSILSHSADAQLAGCNEPRCASDVAHLVNADVLVTGTVDKVGGATVVALSLIDAGSKDGAGDNGDGGPQVIGRQEAAFRGPDDQLLNLARPLAQRLFDGPNAAKHTGSLEVFSQDGVVVVVDGKEVGPTPLASLKDMTTGVHTLGFQKSGYVAQTVDVVVSKNEPTVVRVDLVEESLFEQPWFWAAAGGAVVVAGGVTAGAIAYAAANAEQPTRVVLGKPAE